MNADLLKGPIKRSLLLFAVPLFFSQLFQTLYNTVDTILIGHYLGDVSLAAIGAVASLFELLVGFCTGFGQGLAVLAGQAWGADEKERLNHISGLSILLCLAFSILLSILALAGMKPLLYALKTPADIFDQSYAYISIIAAGLVVTIYYNLCAGMLRALGDATTPLVILLISSVINIILDILFITTFHMGVAGAAWATLLAQLISLVLCVIWIIKKKPELVPYKAGFKWDKELVSGLVSMGLSMALMSSIVSIGTLILQSGINSLGTLKITAYTAARKVYGITILPIISLMIAMGAFAAQNTGAKQFDRVRAGLAFVNRMGIWYGIAITAIVFFFGRNMLALISGSTSLEVLDNAERYLLINTPFLFVLSVVLNVRTTLQSMGLKSVPVFSSVVELIGKILFTFFIIPPLQYLGICICEPVIWCAMALVLCVYYKRNPIFTSVKLHAGIWLAK